MIGDIVIENISPYAADVVWHALTSPAALAEWLMPNDFAPVVGHCFQFRTNPRPNFDGIVRCEVLRVDEPHLISYSWHGGNMAEPSVVTFTLTPANGGTKVTLAHTNFTGPDALMISEMLGNGWRSKILALSLPGALGRLNSSSSEVSSRQNDADVHHVGSGGPGL